MGQLNMLSSYEITKKPLSESNDAENDQRYEWWFSNIIFVTIVHIIALYSILFIRPKLPTLIYCIAHSQFAILGKTSSLNDYNLARVGITMGYHRLWAHRTYEASTALRIILAIMGALAFQGSIKWWVFRHRLHHRYNQSAYLLLILKICGHCQ